MTGHGGSDGLHGYVPSLDYVVEDTVSLLIEDTDNMHVCLSNMIFILFFDICREFLWIKLN